MHLSILIDLSFFFKTRVADHKYGHDKGTSFTFSHALQREEAESSRSDKITSHHWPLQKIPRDMERGLLFSGDEEGVMKDEARKEGAHAHEWQNPTVLGSDPSPAAYWVRERMVGRYIFNLFGALICKMGHDKNLS